VGLDGDRRLLCKRSGGEELSGVGVGCDDPGASCCETDGGVAASAADVENSPAAGVADQASVDILSQTRTKLDVVEGSVARGAGVIAGHVRSVWPR
jgi:hypothetical protein